MLYFLKFLFLLINVDQDTILNWFQIENYNNYCLGDYSANISDISVKSSSNISLDSLKSVIVVLGDKLQDGLTLGDIENILFFVLFIRFVILAVRYNLKTSLYITLIGLFAGYLWYKHLIDLISMYRNVLLKLPFLNNLGMDAVQLRSFHRQMVLTDLKLGDNVHWYNPGQLIYYAIIKGIVDINPETGSKHYVDPLSMVVSSLNEPTKSTVLPLYYKMYNGFIPKAYEICSKFWGQLSGVAAYAVITRIGKRYCPYLIRWHWTFLLIIGMVEQIFIYFVYRVYYFQTFVLIPQTKIYENSINSNLFFQINALNLITTCVVLAHVGLIIFGLFHAIWGQYFYLPFFVENTELHIGPRPKASIYSGGGTAWQDSEEKEKRFGRSLPKLWYGWFGSGTKNRGQTSNALKKLTISFFKKFRKQFRR